MKAWLLARPIIDALGEPEWARNFMAHISIGGLTNVGESLEKQFIGAGTFTKGTSASFYLMWAVGDGVRDVQAHLELRAPIPGSSEGPNCHFEIYHGWEVPKETLLVSDLPYTVVLEEPHLLIVLMEIP